MEINNTMSLINTFSLFIIAIVVSLIATWLLYLNTNHTNLKKSHEKVERRINELHDHIAQDCPNHPNANDTAETMLPVAGWYNTRTGRTILHVIRRNITSPVITGTHKIDKNWKQGPYNPNS